jgi:hypothetical protein
MKIAARELLIFFAIAAVGALVAFGAQGIAALDVQLHNAGFEFQRTDWRDLIFGFRRVGD